MKKKLKQPSFAAAVNRDEVREGAEELGVEFDEHVAFVIEAMAERAAELGLEPREREEPERVRRGTKIALGLLVALVALLAINTIVVDNQTKAAEVTIEGGRILELPGGAVQVFEEGPTAGAAAGAAPIVLLHCYSCSLHWWDKLAPLLAEEHRVIRIDLLGHGGSEKPAGDYEIPEQAALVAARARQARCPGRGRRRPLDGLRRRDGARRAREPARRPARQPRRGPLGRGRLLVPVPRQARLRCR